MDIFDPDYNKKALARKQANQGTLGINPVGDPQPERQSTVVHGMTRTRGEEAIVPSKPASRLNAGRGYGGGVIGTDGSVWR